MEEVKKPNTSHASIIGIFITLMLILGLPLAIIISQQKQDLRQRAQTPEPSQAQNFSNQPKSISGYVYNDQNQNGERDVNETGASNVQIKISQINNIANQPNQSTDITTTVTTDTNGYFKFDYYNTPQSASIQLILPPDHKTINTNPIKIIYPQDNSNTKIYQWGIYPLSQSQ